MYRVSDQYLSESRKPLRDISHVEISYGIADPEATAASDISDNGGLPYSASSQVDLGVSVSRTYNTFERNRTVLDGFNMFYDANEPEYQGFVSRLVSDSLGVFAALKPTILVRFTKYVTFPSITFSFDEHLDEYPTSITFIGYRDGAEVVNMELTPTQSRNSVHRVDAVDVDGVDVIFNTTKTPYRRVRVSSIVWGFTQVFTGADIVSCEYSHTVDPISLELPQQDFAFTILDTTKSYDPDNPSSLWDYLESMQPVKVKIGYTLSNGAIEWADIAVVYTNGEVSVGNQGVVTEVSIQTMSLLELLDADYTEGVYAPDGISLYDLAARVAQFAGIDNVVVLDNSLKDYVTKNPIPQLPVKTCLQLIANAGLCTLNVGRDGRITMTPLNNTPGDYGLGFGEMTSTPETSKLPKIKTLTSGYSKYTPDSDSTEIARVDVEDLSMTTRRIDHGPGTSLSATGSGVTIHSQKHYAFYSEVVASGTGTITISGISLQTSTIAITQDFFLQGLDDSVDTNELISDANHAQKWLAWVGAYLMRRTSYSFSDRGFVEIDTLDNINIETNFSGATPITVIEHTISYSGAVSGSHKGVSI